MNKNTAFSLIELMVVIAVVAILATIAVPAYKTYLTKTKMTMANNFVLSQVDAAIRYYNDHGEFPDEVAQIGLPAGPDANATAMPTGASSYLMGNVGWLRFDNGSFFGTCPRGAIQAFLSNYGEGDAFSNPNDLNASIVQLEHRYIDIDGIILKKCFYLYQKDAEYKSGNFISGCVNLHDDDVALLNEINTLANSCS